MISSLTLCVVETRGKQQLCFIDLCLCMASCLPAITSELGLDQEPIFRSVVGF